MKSGFYTITKSYHALRERGLIEGETVFVLSDSLVGLVIKIKGTTWAINDKNFKIQEIK
jgi:hypothetical protein